MAACTARLLVEAATARQVPIYGLNYKDDPRNAQEWLLRLGDPYAATVADATPLPTSTSSSTHRSCRGKSIGAANTPSFAGALA